MNRITKAELFRNLHAGPEPLPNAWDVASARLIAAEGYPAIASSSAACAGVLGYPDGQRIPRGEMIFLLGRIVQSVVRLVHVIFRSFRATRFGWMVPG
jgi:2-methylisocitrate lyase-like PEP mutase family enzyme